MKKTICLTLTLCVLTLITSCTGYKKLDKIRATDYFSGIECTIPLEIPSGAMTSEFLHTDDNIDEIKAKLDDISSEEGNFTVEDLPYDALLIVYTEDSKNALYLFQEYQLGNITTLNIVISIDFQTFYLPFYVITISKDGLKSQRLEGIPILHHLLRDVFTGNYYDYNEDEYVITAALKISEFIKCFKSITATTL